MKNRISVLAYLVDGSELPILDDVTPHEAIENYFCPDARPPVQSISITITNDSGKRFVISVTQKEVNLYDQG